LFALSKLAEREDGHYNSLTSVQFWRATPRQDEYFAAQRKCQNNAVLQMMDAAVADAHATSRPVLVNANPKTEKEARVTFFAFSDEARQRQQPPAGDSNSLVAIQCFPRMPKCYGWLKFNAHEFGKMPKHIQPQPTKIDGRTYSFSEGRDGEYIAIVYEYIEDGETDTAVVDDVAEFLWLAGFCFCATPLARNWRSGVLVDLSDIVHAGAFGWSRPIYRKRTARTILAT